MQRLAETLALLVIGAAAVVWMNLPPAEEGDGPVADPSVIVGETMGTTYHVDVPAVIEPAVSRELRRAIDARLEDVNDLFSTWRPDSEISRFNGRGGDEPFPVSTETVAVLTAAAEISARTGGLFDATVGPLVDLWSFGPDRRPREVPADAEIEAARAKLGTFRFLIENGESKLRASSPAVRLDLSAIAKGYGVDAVAAVIREAGYDDWLVEVGGEVRVSGRSGRGDAWRLGIEKPLAGERAVERVVPLPAGPDGSLVAMATSGDYRNFFEVEGVRYAHVIDPRTGRPARTDVASASVLAADCMTADAFATACCVAGPEEAYDLLIDNGLEGLLLVATGDGFETLATPGFPAPPADAPEPAPTP